MNEQANQHVTLEVRLLSWVSVSLIIIALLFAASAIVVGVLLRNFHEQTIIALINTPIIGVLLGAVGAMSALSLRQGRLVWLMRATVLLAVITATLALLALWTWAYGRPVLESTRLLITLLAAVAAMAIIGRLLTPRVESELLRLAQWSAAGAAVIFAASMIGLAWSWPLWEMWEDLVAMIATTWGFATLIYIAIVGTLIRRTAKPKKQSNESIPDKLALRLTCPDCGEEQTLRTGLGHCVRCRFAMLIEIQEPRCECGYLIYRLSGPTCPECGRAIAPLS